MFSDKVSQGGDISIFDKSVVKGGIQMRTEVTDKICWVHDH